MRKHLGYGHIPARFAEQVNHFAQNVLSPYLNYHRPCLFAREHADTKGKVRKTYPYGLIQTPYDKLKSLPNAAGYLKAGVDFEQLDAIAYSLSDNDAARQLNAARNQLFKSINPAQTPADNHRQNVGNPVLFTWWNAAFGAENCQPLASSSVKCENFEDDRDSDEFSLSLAIQPPGTTGWSRQRFCKDALGNENVAQTSEGDRMLSQNTRIAIIGGGLGGLTAAIALKKIAGIQATVFEQAKGHDEVGAGITIAPNASRILDELGILEKFQRAGATPEAEGLYVDAMGNVVTDAAWEDTAREYQNIDMYRPDYLEILGQEVGSEAILFGHRLTSVETLGSGVRVHFDNGVQEEFDAVVGADGVHSVVREALGQHREPVDYGYIAYRGVIDASGLPEDWPKISKTWMGHDRHLMTYPLRNDHSLYNYVAAIPSNKGLKGQTSGPADRSELEADFGIGEYDWDPNVHKFISLIDETFWWSLFDVEPLTNWSCGPVALLGDSAHCMVPHQGQGVNMATEDSITLAFFLKQAGSVRDIPEAFKRYTAVRMQRAAILQNQSRRAGWMFNAQQQFSDTKKRDADITAGRDFRRRSVFDYDALKVAEKALKRFERN